MLKHLHQFEHEVSEKSDLELVELLVINAQESTNKEYSEALKVIKLEILKRME